jgi:RHS repeat-associated protein
LEPLRGEEGQNGYTPLSAGVWQDLNANMQCLFDDTELSFGGDMLYLQSIVEESIVFDDGEGGEITDPTELDPTLACEQSLYWANLGGVNCAAVELIYFYHPDYLGSVEFVTDMRGEPYQFFLNSPWGENLENQFAHTYTSFSSRFRFNDSQEQSKALIEGSVRSTEWEDRALRNRPVAYFSEGASLPRWRGNLYYGARYYDPKVSVWLSADPLAGKAPHLTPYRFSFNNPLNVVDPNGLFEGWVKSLETGEYDWDDCAENQETTAEGYEFIGMEDSDVLEDMGYCETQKSFQDMNLCVFQYQDETTAFSWGVAGSTGVFKSDVDVNIGLEVLESEDHKSKSNEKGKYIAGVRVAISGSVSSPTLDSNPMFSLTGCSVSTVEGGEYSNSWVYTRRQKPKSLWRGQQHIVNPQSIGVGSTLIPIYNLHGGAPINVSVKGYWHVNNVTVGMPSFLGLIFTTNFRGNLTF